MGRSETRTPCAFKQIHLLLEYKDRLGLANVVD